MSLVDVRQRDPSAYGTSEAGIDYADPSSAGVIEPDKSRDVTDVFNTTIEKMVVVGGVLLGSYLIYRIWRH